MTMNPVTVARVEADKMDIYKRHWLREGIKTRIPLPRLAVMFSVPVVSVRNILIADRDEFDDETWESYEVKL